MCLTWYIHLYMYSLATSEHIPAYSWLQVNIVNYLSGFLQKVVPLLSCVWLFMTPWTAARQSSLSLTFSRSLPKSCQLSRWCHPTTSSSAILFSFCLQSFPASGSFQWLGCWHQVAKVLAFQLQHQSFQWIFRADVLYDSLIWPSCCPIIFYFFFKCLFLMAVL